jgi:hypothetical protein
MSLSVLVLSDLIHSVKVKETWLRNMCGEYRIGAGLQPSLPQHTTLLFRFYDMSVALQCRWLCMCTKLKVEHWFTQWRRDTRCLKIFTAKSSCSSSPEQMQTISEFVRKIGTHLCRADQSCNSYSSSQLICSWMSKETEFWNFLVVM